MVHLLQPGGQLLHAAAVDDVHFFRTQPPGAARGVHGHVAPAHHRYALAVHDGGEGILFIGFHQVDAGQVLIGGVHALEGLARDAHEARQARAAGDEDGLKVHLQQLINGQCLANHGVEHDVHAQAFQGFHFGHHDVLGQAELRDAVAQDAAGQVQGFKHGDRITHARQLARGGQPAGARAHHRHLMPVGLRRRRQLAGAGAVPVRSIALQPADGHALPLEGAHTALLALAFLRAHAPADCGQGA